VSRLASLLLFLGVVLAVLGGMHGYLWLRLVRDPGLPEPWRRIATWLLVGAALLVPTGMLASRLAGRHLSRILPMVAFTWLGMAFLLFSALLALDAVRLLSAGAGALTDWLRHVPDAPPDPERRQLLARAVAGGALVAAGAAGLSSWRSASGPAEVEDVPVRLARLPPALSGLSIAQLTDLHVGPTIRERELRRVVDQTNALRPDLVAITGDFINGARPTPARNRAAGVREAASFSSADLSARNRLTTRSTHPRRSPQPRSTVWPRAFFWPGSIKACVMKSSGSLPRRRAISSI
jgi:hypothetical protein